VKPQIGEMTKGAKKIEFFFAPFAFQNLC